MMDVAALTEPQVATYANKWKATGKGCGFGGTLRPAYGDDLTTMVKRSIKLLWTKGTEDGAQVRLEARIKTGLQQGRSEDDSVWVHYCTITLDTAADGLWFDTMGVLVYEGRLGGRLT